MKTVLTLIIFSFVTSSALALSNDPSLCYNKRLTPSNYPFLYKKTKKHLKKIKGSSFTERFEILEQEEGNHTELCAWNKFLFVDFLIYFNRFDDYELEREANLLSTLKLRDELYQKWLEANKNAIYADYANSDLKDMELKDFLARPSEKFAYITKPLKLLNRRPKNDKAKQYVYDLLEARSPFNSIFSSKSIELLLDNETQGELLCLNHEMQQSFHDALIKCFPSRTRMLEIIGVLASQRMYLLRDFSSFIKQNYTNKDYTKFYTNAALSSSLYFKMETLAHAQGAQSVYPLESSKLISPKPYHFYSVAFIANSMKQAGFSNEDIRRIANIYAVKYKKSIKLIGVIYNTISGISLKEGSVGDSKQILKEQKLGIEYGLSNKAEME